MRVTIKRALQWVLGLVVVQIIIYYWTTRKSQPTVYKIRNNRVLGSVAQLEGVCSVLGCPTVKEGEINVHLIPHSHFDVGWVKNVEQYYVGETIPNVWATGCVRCTFNSTITELLKDKKRRFIFSEMKYLSRYWQEIDDKQKADIVQLIKERRLEIVSGGWVSSDAAVTAYNDIIDQHTLGFDFIRDTLGSCAQPRTGWHVDQFGHSREHASIFAQMGFDSLFLGRLDFQDFQQRTRERNLETVWLTSPKNLKLKSHLFTHIIYGGYYAPEPYMFESDSINWQDVEVAEKAAVDFIDVVKERMKGYKTNHLMIPMGCDFGYQEYSASNWFFNMDNLMRMVDKVQVNATSKLNLLYSTPSCYAYNVNRQRARLQLKFDDFFPYGIEPGAYWSGLFTTRGGFKMHIKRAGQILQSCKQLSIFAGQDNLFGTVNKLRDAMGVMQHHDAITGTQRLAVLNDYNAILSDAIGYCEKAMSQSYAHLWQRDDSMSNQRLPLTSHFCPDLNVSSCPISEAWQPFLVSLYNPLGWGINVSIRLPVKAPRVLVLTSDTSPLPVQLLPVAEALRSIPERVSQATMEAVFQAYLPPMSSVSLLVRPQTDEGNTMTVANENNDSDIENEYLKLRFNVSTGRLQGVVNKVSQVMAKVEQDFAFYISDDNKQRVSGAYLFVPEGKGSQPVTKARVQMKVYKNAIVQEVHQKFNSWVSQVVRLYKGAKFAEFQWVVGPLDNSNGREVISRFTSSINSGNTFYTDSNGREMIMRIRRTQDYGTIKMFDPISANYYPVTSRMFIQDDEKRVQMTILPDRPQGGSSLSQGSLELMVHRRVITDDNLGIAEPVMDQGADDKGIVYTGKHYLCLDTVENSARLVKHLALQIHLAPVPMFTPLKDDGDSLRAPKLNSFLYNTLPDNVHVLTLDRIAENETNFYLLRLEHVFEEREGGSLSTPVEVNLESLFTPFRVIHVEETTLGGNFRPHEINRLTWETSRGATLPSITSSDYKTYMERPFTIKLRPMEIRTFRLHTVSMASTSDEA